MTVQIASSCLPTKHRSARHGLQGLPALLCPLGSCGSERPFLVLEQIEIERWEAGETDPDRRGSTKGRYRVRDCKKNCRVW